MKDETNMIFKNSLFAFDVDGTLLNSYGELTQRTIEAIATASDQGATITLATCLLYTSPSPRDVEEPRMPSSA